VGALHILNKNCYSCDELKEDEMYGTCSMHVLIKMLKHFGFKIRREDLSLDGNITLKLIRKKYIVWF
jgi:hypothetical protein